MNDEMTIRKRNSLDSEINEQMKELKKKTGNDCIIVLKINGKKIDAVPPVTIEIAVEPVKVEQTKRDPAYGATMNYINKRTQVVADCNPEPVITTTAPIVENKKFDVLASEYKNTLEFLNRCVEAYPGDKFVLNVKNYFEKWGKITEPQRMALAGSLDKYNNRMKKANEKGE